MIIKTGSTTRTIPDRYVHEIYSERLLNTRPVCPLCSEQAGVFAWKEPGNDGFYFEGKCDRCGVVQVLGSAADEAKRMQKVHLLSAYFRGQSEQGLTPSIVDESNVVDILRSLPMLKTVPEKLNAVLRLAVAKNPVPGTKVTISMRNDYPLVFAANESELRFLFDQLRRRGLVVMNSQGAGDLIVTADGYERLEQLAASEFKTSRNGFVAMSFDESRNSIYREAIEPAVSEAGYQAIRIDKTEHINRIDDEIIAQIRQSRFMVADFTGQRAGVYWEAGFMHGLGRNVYWMCEQTELDKVHFDTRQYNFIDYLSAAEAKKRLYDRIMAIEGKGPGEPVS
jgi:nucleoside 2-deoxyribosyltransferase